MSNNCQPPEDDLQVKKPLLSLKRPVLVQCEKFRCLARQDMHGKWRSVFGDAELTTFVSVIDPQNDR